VRSGETGLDANGELYRKDIRESMESMMNERPSSLKHESEYTLDEIATKMNATIKDSGERRQFYDTEGNPMAVRDVQEGKGRCDLMPLDVVATLLNDEIICDIASFVQTSQVVYLYNVLKRFSTEGIPSMLLEVAKHFEAGNKKYPPDADGTPNWKKGIPIHSFVDSAVRHYLKWLRGDKDEAHDLAFCWNILCCIWTCRNKPELNDFGGRI
jgi:hypothetical protein